MNFENKTGKIGRTKAVALTIILMTAAVTGCLSSESENDNSLVIVTYDVYALSDEMISTFENQTGIEVEMVKLADSGSILSYLIQQKGTGANDLAIGLDNTHTFRPPLTSICYRRARPTSKGFPRRPTPPMRAN